MNPNDAIHDPVFQLNLLVWMAKDQPAEGFRVRPVFSKYGFQLHYIEQPFPFPTELRGAIEEIATAKKLKIKLHPEPELTVQRPTDGQAIYFEAKAHGFSSSSSNSEQARGHLLACGPAFAEVYKPLTKALLDYVVPATDRFDSKRKLPKEGLRGSCEPPVSSEWVLPRYEHQNEQDHTTRSAGQEAGSLRAGWQRT